MSMSDQVSNSVTVTWTNRNGTSYSQTQALEPGEGFAFIPEETSPNAFPSCSGGTSSTCIGSAKAVGQYDIAGATLEWVEQQTVQTIALAASALGDTNGTHSAVSIPSLKNDYYDASTSAGVLNVETSGSSTVDLDFYVTGTEGSCGDSVGDSTTDQISLDAEEEEVVSYGNSNVGGLYNCTFYSMNATGDANEDLAIQANQNHSGTKKTKYNGYPNNKGKADLYVPLYKEDFPGGAYSGRQGGITVMNVSTTCSEFDLTFRESTNESVVRTIELCENEAVTVRRISDWPASDEAKYSVHIEAVDHDARAIRLYLANSYSGGDTTDIITYELLWQ